MKNIFLFIFIFLFSLNVFPQTVQKIYLHDNWEFRKSNDSIWYPATVPGTIHTDLLNNKLIPDPYFGDNEKSLQWIENENWEYKTTFVVNNDLMKLKNIQSIFEGIDTYADVYLNGKYILFADNMFADWKVDFKKYIKSGNNELKIIFYSAVKKNDSIASLSDVKLSGSNYSFSRKSPYHFGWDWGPRFVTCGIWKPVYIVAYNDAKIESPYFYIDTIYKNMAKLKASYFINVIKKDLYRIKISESNSKTIYIEKTDSLYEGLNYDILSFEIPDPKLWWTNELGSPNLYYLKIEIFKNEKLIDEQTKKIGLRTVELIREKDNIGESFYFKLNGIPLFIKGANYIPQDNFLPRVSKEKYKNIIGDASISNINMLRVWGGGTYEDEEFYNQCDERGILVWQDFMFACAMYPGDKNFIEKIKQEAFNIERLRNHPCIALWCGNNEIDEGWKNWGWQKEFNYNQKDSENIYNDYKKIFEFELPSLLEYYYKPIDFSGTEKYKSKINYITTSPKIGWGHKEAMTEGDSHYWGVWWGNEPFDIYEKKIPRFMSEYGFQGFPDMETIKSFTNPEDRFLYSDVIKSHQKHPTGFETIQNYLECEYKQPKDFESYVYTSQLLQAYGIKKAIEAHRRAKPYCMGTMYWQLNDCWPSISWSGIDYEGRWKALQYFVEDAYREILISPIIEEDKLKIYIISDRLKYDSGILHLRLIDFNGNILWQADTNITIQPNTSLPYYEISSSDLLSGFNKNEIVLTADIRSYYGENFKNNFYFNLPKELNLRKTEPKIEIYDFNNYGFILNISTDRLLKNLYLKTIDGVTFGDNLLDIIPGDTVHVFCETKIPREDFIKQLKYISLIDTY